MTELMTDTFEAAMTRAVASLRRVDELNEQYRAGIGARQRTRRPPRRRAGDRHPRRAASAGVARRARRRRRAACSSRCRWRSIPRSRSGRISRSSIATPAASRTASSTWARSSPPRRSARTIPRWSARCSNRCRSSPSRYAHSEYQTVLSLRLKAELNRIAPAGTPRHFIVNTGAEAVENAIKAVLHESRHDVAGRRRRLHRLVRRRVPRPHAGRARRHAPQEGAARLSDVRLAAHPVSGRRGPRRRRRPRAARSAA